MRCTGAWRYVASFVAFLMGACVPAAGALSASSASGSVPAVEPEAPAALAVGPGGALYLVDQAGGCVSMVLSAP